MVIGSLVVETEPAAEPVSTADMKTHVRQDSSADDTYIAGLVTAARRHVEEIQNRSLIDTTWNLWLDEWPAGREITLPRWPLSSVTSIKHYDDAGTESTFASTGYIVDAYQKPGRVVLVDNGSWPSGDLRAVNAIKVTFVAGHGTSASDVPEDAVHLVKLLAANWYESRTPVVTGTITSKVPDTLEMLLWRDRMVLRV